MKPATHKSINDEQVRLLKEAIKEQKLWEKRAKANRILLLTGKLLNVTPKV